MLGSGFMGLTGIFRVPPQQIFRMPRGKRAKSFATVLAVNFTADLSLPWSTCKRSFSKQDSRYPKAQNTT